MIVWKWSLNGNSNAQVWSNGTSTNVTWVDWKMNWWAKFTLNTSQIEIPHTTEQELQTFTWELLIKLEWTTFAHCLYKKRWSASFDIAYNVIFTTTWIAFYQMNWSSYILSQIISWTFLQNKIYYLTIIKEPTLWKVYVDWVLFWQITAPNISYSTGNKNTWIWKNPVTTAETMNGIVDELTLHNTALTPAEVKNKYLYYNWFM